MLYLELVCKVDIREEFLEKRSRVPQAVPLFVVKRRRVLRQNCLLYARVGQALEIDVNKTLIRPLVFLFILLFFHAKFYSNGLLLS